MPISQIEEFYFLKIKKIWSYIQKEHFSFWMISFYLFFEYSRPQAIYPAIDIIPWAQLFLLASLLGAIFDKSVKWVSSPINFFMALFAIVIFFSSLNAYYPEASKSRYVDFYSWFVVYFLIINIINSKERFYLFLLLFILCAAKIAVGTTKSWASRGFSFTNWGLMGPTGYFQNSGELAILMLTLFPIAYLVYEHLKDRVTSFEKLLLVFFWVTPILTILGASSRGAQIALAIQLALIFRRKIFKLHSLIGIVILVMSLYSVLPEEQIKRFESAGADKTSVQRLLYWKNGWEMMKSHPFLGVGYFNFPLYYEEHYPEDMLYKHAEFPHNIIIQVGTDAGFIGLFPFVMLLILPFWISRKVVWGRGPKNIITIGISGTLYGILGFILAGQFVTVAYYPFLWVGLGFVVAGLNVYRKSIKHELVIKN